MLQQYVHLHFSSLKKESVCYKTYLLAWPCLQWKSSSAAKYATELTNMAHKAVTISYWVDTVEQETKAGRTMDILFKNIRTTVHSLFNILEEDTVQYRVLVLVVTNVNLTN